MGKDIVDLTERSVRTAKSVCEDVQLHKRNAT